MAVDKLVDSTQLDSDLTSVANAIRTKGGTSAQLAFPAGFVSAIGDIQTGGTVSVEWANVSEITIGANTISKSSEVASYFDPSTYGNQSIFILESALTTQNQCVYFANIYDTSGANTQNHITRYKDGQIRSTAVGTNYDCVLVEGTKYLVISKKAA